ncbi:hypothetical protein K2173_025099 [Erythroxylum novogranatense]|uniref:PGG domain-containing protein n=1 Tax=Erythroxylum novogranatense TaxID=1862640 RepID=A0AAV8SVM1_9ROSI|nr:hypothetical protein K2173_025099 [Erythroxylum novogranatense]
MYNRLTIANYPEWSVSMRKNLKAEGLWEAVKPKSIPRNSDDWRAKNNIALFTIRSFCHPLILLKIHSISSSKIVWDTLAKMYELQLHGIYRVDPPQNKGDWIGLKAEIDSHPEALNAKVALSGQLLIHIAAGAGKGEITQELAKLMKKSDLEIQDSWGCTALTNSAYNGMTKTCEFLISLNNNLVCIPNIHGALPVVAACSGAHRETTSYLYSLTPFDRFRPENGCNGALLHCYCIFSGLLDVGLDLLRRCPALTLAPDSRRYIPFSVLATAASKFYSNGITWRILKLLGKLLCHISAKELRDLPIGVVENALTEAVKNGIVEFVVELIKACPQRMYYPDIFGRNVIMAAISYRQEKIYSLIYGFDSENNGWTASFDFFGNNMLHLAGTLAPESQLASISGAALQMQRELQWFKEVESLVPPYHKDLVNMEGEKPQQIFDNSHKQLMADGEKWMKECATSSTVVGALIITVMFAAIFTVPSGSPLARDKPISSYQKPYLVFIISDSISLFASSNSVLMFLGILTSRYSQEDFLVSLPTKLIIGLSTLFFSIASMMVSFCATLVTVLNEQWHIVIPIVLLASVPVTLFIWLQFTLLVEIFKYTYGSGIFDKKMKQWY